MDSLIKTLHGFTDHLGSFQTGIQNLEKVIPTVIDSAKQLSKELSQLPSSDVLRNLHKPVNLGISPPATQPIVGKTNSDPNPLSQIELALMKSQSYEKRSNIYYSEAALAIDEAYQFNHGIFKDNLSSSYINFISSIDKEFTPKDKYSSRLPILP